MKKNRPRYVNAVQRAIEAAGKLTPDERAEFVGIASTALHALKINDNPRQQWATLIDMTNIGLQLADMGLCSLDENKEMFRRAQSALESLLHRHEHLGTWAMKSFEIEALADAIFLLDVQTEHASRREISTATSKVAERARQALKGNASPGTKIVTIRANT